MSASTGCAIFLLLFFAGLFVMKMYAERADTISRVVNLSFTLGALSTAGYLFFTEAALGTIISVGLLCLFVYACWQIDHFLIKPRLRPSSRCECGEI